jgi:hypothetical protein
MIPTTEPAVEAGNDELCKEGAPPPSKKRTMIEFQVGRRSGMSDWKSKLASLGAQLNAEEAKVDAAKKDRLQAFRKALKEYETVLQDAEAFGDAFGVDLTWEIARFDSQYPYLRLTIPKPLLRYELNGKDGELMEFLQEGSSPVQRRQLTVAEVAPKKFSEKLTAWIQAAAQANRKVPGKR